ncbi:hypothetical protein GNP68_19025 [Aliivibrio fischeri]|nr:hypothetical protein [Aliivibrio fischeri]
MKMYCSNNEQSMLSPCLDIGMYTMKPKINQYGERERQIWPHKKQKGYPF